MNIDQLEAFLNVVQLKTVHKASKALYLSQPTISARIKSLERELDAELFFRQGRQLFLNEKGKEFIPYAEQILQIFKESKQQLTNQEKQNEVIFGANAIVAQYFIPYALGFWKRWHPSLTFKFITGTDEELLMRLLNYEIDFVFTQGHVNEKIQQDAMLDNSMQLIVYPEHPFVKDRTITIEKLAEQSLVFFECDTFNWFTMQEQFEAVQKQPTIQFKVDHVEVAKSIIKNKQSIGFLPSLCVKHELENGELIKLDMPSIAPSNQSIYLSYLQNNPLKQLKASIEKTIQHFYSETIFQ